MRIPKNLLILIGSLLLCLLTFEGLLHLEPGIFGQDLENAFLNGYSATKRGIFTYDPQTGINFMKPNQTRLLYYDGYTWLHRTDSYGFRNSKEYSTADILLVGDSMVYGHGVNKTVAEFLEELSDYDVYNLARVGDSSFQERYMLASRGLELKPKYIIYFFYLNDITDLSDYLTPESVDFFINNQSVDDWGVHRVGLSPYGLAAYVHRFSDKSRFVTTFFYIMHRLIVPPYDPEEVNMDDPRWEYTYKAISQMSMMAESINATFIIVPLASGEQLFMIQRLAETNNITIWDDIYPQLNDSLRLPGDGHFNEAGHRLLAQLILQRLG